MRWVFFAKNTNWITETSSMLIHLCARKERWLFYTHTLSLSLPLLMFLFRESSCWQAGLKLPWRACPWWTVQGSLPPSRGREHDTPQFKCGGINKSPSAAQRIDSIDRSPAFSVLIYPRALTPSFDRLSPHDRSTPLFPLSAAAHHLQRTPKKRLPDWDSSFPLKQNSISAAASPSHGLSEPESISQQEGFSLD
jgi:hypothetical protein